jgi:hypothetical protein
MCLTHTSMHTVHGTQSHTFLFADYTPAATARSLLEHDMPMYMHNMHPEHVPGSKARRLGALAEGYQRSPRRLGNNAIPACHWLQCLGPDMSAATAQHSECTRVSVWVTS